MVFQVVDGGVGGGAVDWLRGCTLGVRSEPFYTATPACVVHLIRRLVNDSSYDPHNKKSGNITQVQPDFSHLEIEFHRFHLLHNTIAVWMESIFGLSDKISREELMIVEVVDWVKLLRQHILLNSPILGI